MEIFTIKSKFKSLPIEIYWYPAKIKMTKVVLLVKGIYGLHIPHSKKSWENELISKNKRKYNFICINTSRIGQSVEERKTKEAFLDKTFNQECSDVEAGFNFLKKKILPNNFELTVIGNSFGGTSLLSIKNIIENAFSIILIASGCGKSSTTKKPLLSTLPNEDVLLSKIKKFKGIFFFIRGTEDSIVPKQSQDKIINCVTNAKIKTVIDVRNASHDLTIEKTQGINREKILSSVLKISSEFSQRF